jgi:hypothetical protein
MTHDSGGSGPELLGVRALREWITGERHEYSRVILVEPGASAEGVTDVVGDDDVILLPAGSGPYAGRARSAHYSGALCEIGDELFFGERSVELQDYVAAAFVQIVGPTAVSLVDQSSWEAFVDDAELARRTGIFPSPLIDPRVLLADRSALLNPDELTTPSAIRVTPGGGVGIGMRGDVIGTVGQLETLLEVPLPRAAAWGSVLPAEVLAADLSSRAWIGRYLHATDLMKMLRLENGAVRISGFGWFGLDDDLADAEPLTADPFLLDTAEGFVLADTTTLRRQLLSPATATVAAAIQTSSTPEVAAERVARQLGRPASEAHRLCLEAVTALNVHVGRRSSIPSPTTGRET